VDQVFFAALLRESLQEVDEGKQLLGSFRDLQGWRRRSKGLVAMGANPPVS
jgi:hypothetical protein